jgi:glycerophosphoryl diester phosphodiesterase
MSETKPPVYIYHGGIVGNGTKENTFGSISQVSRGNSIELDILLSKDGYVINVHPRDLGLTIEQAEDLCFKEINNNRGERDRLFHLNLDDLLKLAYTESIFLLLDLKASDAKKFNCLVNKIYDSFDKFKVSSDKMAFLAKNVSFIFDYPDGANTIATCNLQNGLGIRSTLFWTSGARYAREKRLSASQVVWARKFESKMNWSECGIMVAKSLKFSSISFSVHCFLSDNNFKIIVDEARSLGLRVGLGLVNQSKVLKGASELGFDFFVLSNRAAQK